MSSGAIATSAVLACAAAACAWKSAPRLGHPSPGSRRFWNAQAACLFSLGLCHAFAVDAWVLQWGRQLVLANGLYGWRRPFQAALLLAGLFLAVKLLQRWRLGRTDSALAQLRLLCACATAVIAVVFGARAVSLHGLDDVLTYRIFGPGLGRWLEWGAAAVVCAAAAINGHRSPAHTSTLKAWEPPRV
ncbi:MAG: hypothetical protein QE285_04055 [Aquabacterium sp.]|nr:hypothetical protein [Aquabacterium sp.]